MDKKIVKFSGRFFLVIASLVTLFSLAALTMIILVFVLKDGLQDLSIWIYNLFGEFLLPLQMLVDINGDASILVIILVSLLVFIFTLIALIASVKARNAKTKRKNLCTILSIILSAILFAFVVFLLVMYIINYRWIGTMYAAFAIYLAPNSSSLIANILLIKGLVILFLFATSSFFVFITYIINKEKAPVGQKTDDNKNNELSFYSDEYELKATNEIKEEDLSSKTAEKDDEKKNKVQPRKQAQDLVTKIMQLNELKDTGQITEVEYTRLRQKAVRRYKV